MIDLYLSSATDRGLSLKRSLEGSLPGLTVSGPVLEGQMAVERGRYMADIRALQAGVPSERYCSEVDYDAVLRGHLTRQ